MTTASERTSNERAMTLDELHRHDETDDRCHKYSCERCSMIPSKRRHRHENSATTERATAFVSFPRAPRNRTVPNGGCRRSTDRRAHPRRRLCLFIRLRLGYAGISIPRAPVRNQPRRRLEVGLNHLQLRGSSLARYDYAHASKPPPSRDDALNEDRVADAAAPAGGDEQ